MKSIFTLVFTSFMLFATAQVPSLNWAFGFPGGNGKACAVKTDNSGNVYIAGNFLGTIDLDPSPSTATIQSFGNSDIYLAKYDGNGNFIWGKMIGGTTALDYARAMTLDNNGNIYITGSTDGNSDFDPSASVATLSTTVQHLYFAKYDNNGNYVFAKILQATGGDEGLGITVDNTGNIYVTGSKQGQVDFDPSANTVYLNNIGNSDSFLAKYDNTGAYVWAMNLGSSLNDFGYGIQCDQNNDIIIAGEFRNLINFDPIGGTPTGTLVSNGQADGYLAKYSSNGNLVWAKNIGSSSSDNIRNIQLDNSNNILLCGEYRNACDFDPSASSFTVSENANGGAYVAKYDNNGVFIWAKGFTGPNNEAATSLASDASGNVYVGGYFYSNTDFDPTAGTNTLVCIGSSDFFVLGLNSSGTMLFATSHGGTNSETSNSLAVYGTKLINLGDFSQTVDFDPAPSTYTLFTSGTSSAYVQNLSIANFVTGIKNYTEDNLSFRVYPNPSSGEISFSSNDHSAKVDLVIYNQLGQIIKKIPQISSGEIIKTGLPVGLYTCILNSETKTYPSIKLIIQ